MTRNLELNALHLIAKFSCTAEVILMVIFH